MNSIQFAKKYDYSKRTVQYYLKEYGQELEQKRVIRINNKTGIRQQYVIIQAGRLDLILKNAMSRNIVN